MSTPLAQVTQELEIPRGVDLRLSLSLSPEMYRPKTELVVVLPARLACAKCEGGGCSACKNAGAVRLHPKNEDASPDKERETVRFSLPEVLPEGGVSIRLPHHGAEAEEPELPRGHLILILKSSDVASENLRLLKPGPLSEGERNALAKKSVVVVGGLIVLFIFLLRLSGWL